MEKYFKFWPTFRSSNVITQTHIELSYEVGKVKFWRGKMISALKELNNNYYDGHRPITPTCYSVFPLRMRTKTSEDYRMYNIGIQMKQKELTKTFMMISNWRKLFGLHRLYRKYIFQRFKCGRVNTPKRWWWQPQNNKKGLKKPPLCW